MNEQVNVNVDQAIINKIDAGIQSIQELRSTLQVLRLASNLNKGFMFIDRQCGVSIRPVR